MPSDLELCNNLISEFQQLNHQAGMWGSPETEQQLMDRVRHLQARLKVLDELAQLAARLASKGGPKPIVFRLLMKYLSDTEQWTKPPGMTVYAMQLIDTKPYRIGGIPISLAFQAALDELRAAAQASDLAAQSESWSDFDPLLTATREVYGNFGNEKISFVEYVSPASDPKAPIRSLGLPPSLMPDLACMRFVSSGTMVNPEGVRRYTSIMAYSQSQPILDACSALARKCGAVVANREAPPSIKGHLAPEEAWYLLMFNLLKTNRYLSPTTFPELSKELAACGVEKVTIIENGLSSMIQALELAKRIAPVGKKPLVTPGISTNTEAPGVIVQKAAGGQQGTPDGSRVKDDGILINFMNLLQSYATGEGTVDGLRSALLAFFPQTTTLTQMTVNDDDSGRLEPAPFAPEEELRRLLQPLLIRVNAILQRQNTSCPQLFTFGRTLSITDALSVHDACMTALGTPMTTPEKPTDTPLPAMKNASQDAKISDTIVADGREVEQIDMSEGDWNKIAFNKGEVAAVINCRTKELQKVLGKANCRILSRQRVYVLYTNISSAWAKNLKALESQKAMKRAEHADRKRLRKKEK